MTVQCVNGWRAKVEPKFCTHERLKMYLLLKKGCKETYFSDTRVWKVRLFAPAQKNGRVRKNVLFAPQKSWGARKTVTLVCNRFFAPRVQKVRLLALYMGAKSTFFSHPTVFFVRVQTNVPFSPRCLKSTFFCTLSFKSKYIFNLSWVQNLGSTLARQPFTHCTVMCNILLQ